MRINLKPWTSYGRRDLFYFSKIGIHSITINENRKCILCEVHNYWIMTIIKCLLYQSSFFRFTISSFLISISIMKTNLTVNTIHPGVLFFIPNAWMCLTNQVPISQKMSKHTKLRINNMNIKPVYVEIFNCTA